MSTLNEQVRIVISMKLMVVVEEAAKFTSCQYLTRHLNPEIKKMVDQDIPVYLRSYLDQIDKFMSFNLPFVCKI